MSQAITQHEAMKPRLPRRFFRGRFMALTAVLALAVSLSGVYFHKSKRRHDKAAKAAMADAAHVMQTLAALDKNKSKSKHRHDKAALAAKDDAAHVLQTLAAFDKNVRPLLMDRCASCHGAKRRAGGLRVDTVSALLKGGDSGPAIVPGMAESSLLVQRIASHEMPEGGPPLADEQIHAFRAWIDAGAPAPPGEVAPTVRSNHWAFQPLLPPAIPSTVDAWDHNNPIDAFIANVRAQAGLKKHNPPADKDILLRRVFLDLTGLLPTAEERQEFLHNPSPDAYEKVIDKLLASPRYGERWARHWMDVWRYSSHDERPAFNGSATTHSNKYIWRWRDYLLQSINADKGFNSLIVEMLAGDEISPGDERSMAATGFLVCHYDALDRNLWLNTAVDHTAKAFLGLTLGCARCHHHKFDQISQREFYSFRAFFECYEVDSDDSRKLACAKDGGIRPTYLFVRGDPRAPNKNIVIEPQVPEILGKVALCQPVQAQINGKLVSSHGRRLALANWLVADDNPLVARVLVNHVWLRLFGKGLVANPADFGVRSKVPMHLDLLNWMAVSFRDHGWNMKWLHRLLVTSATYKMASTNLAMADAFKTDPANELYWRVDSRRLEAEVVRDNILHLAGKLDSTMGGPDESHLTADTSRRRSLYVRVSRVDRAPFLEIFDAASVDECYQRAESIVPQQSLALLNSRFVWRHAQQMATHLRSSADFVTSAFELVLGRSPSEEEKEVCRRFLNDQELFLRSSGLRDAKSRARTYLVHGLLNHNDFITLR